MAFDNNDGRLRGRKLQATRLRIWSNYPYCAMCNKLVAYPQGFELDHKQSIENNGSNDDDNLQVLCIELGESGTKTGCHISKTAKDRGYKQRATFDKQGRVVW